MNDINNIKIAIVSFNSNDLLRVLLDGDESFDKKIGLQDTNCNYQIYKSTQRFEKSLLIYTNYPLIITIDK